MRKGLFLFLQEAIRAYSSDRSRTLRKQELSRDAFYPQVVLEGGNNYSAAKYLPHIIAAVAVMMKLKFIEQKTDVSGLEMLRAYTANIEALVIALFEWKYVYNCDRTIGMTTRDVCLRLSLRSSKCS